MGCAPIKRHAGLGATQLFSNCARAGPKSESNSTKSRVRSSYASLGLARAQPTCYIDTTWYKPYKPIDGTEPSTAKPRPDSFDSSIWLLTCWWGQRQGTARPIFGWTILGTTYFMSGQTQLIWHHYLVTHFEHQNTNRPSSFDSTIWLLIASTKIQPANRYQRQNIFLQVVCHRTPYRWSGCPNIISVTSCTHPSMLVANPASQSAFWILRCKSPIKSICV